MRLHVQPIVALCDQRIDICVSELPAHGKVKIGASFCLPWAKGALYESAAWFTAGGDGRVDLSRQVPDSGSYDFVDSMGLIVSAKSHDPRALEKITRNISRNEPFGYTHTYKKGLAAAKNRESARIRVEDAGADLLIITGKACNMWNTYDGCVEIMDTLCKCDYSHRYDMVVYEDAGEPYYVPYVFPAGEISMKMAPRLVLSMGGTLAGNALARADSWERTIRFFGATTR